MTVTALSCTSVDKLDLPEADGVAGVDGIGPFRGFRRFTGLAALTAGGQKDGDHGTMPRGATQRCNLQQAVPEIQLSVNDLTSMAVELLAWRRDRTARLPPAAGVSCWARSASAPRRCWPAALRCTPPMSSSPSACCRARSPISAAAPLRLGDDGVPGRFGGGGHHRERRAGAGRASVGLPADLACSRVGSLLCALAPTMELLLVGPVVRARRADCSRDSGMR